MTPLKFKDYFGSVELDMDRDVLRGKILFVNDLVTYEAKTPMGLQKEFEAAVVDYLALCAEIGKEPQKAFSGQFNVRVEPECHRDLALLAIDQGVTLNAVVRSACQAYVTASRGVAAKVEHLHKVEVTVTGARAEETSFVTVATSVAAGLPNVH